MVAHMSPPSCKHDENCIALSSIPAHQPQGSKHCQSVHEIPCHSLGVTGVWVSRPVFESMFVYKTTAWRPQVPEEDQTGDPVYCASPGLGQRLLERRSAQNVSAGLLVCLHVIAIKS